MYIFNHLHLQWEKQQNSIIPKYFGKIICIKEVKRNHIRKKTNVILFRKTFFKINGLQKKAKGWGI